MRLTAVVLTRNEENAIVDCLETLTFCDEIIIIDDNSADRTVELAKRAGATVYRNSLGDDFSKQRNFGLERARGEWALFVDADERVTEELREEILHAISSQNVRSENLCSFYIRRIDYMWGRWLQHGEAGSIRLLRLGKKDAGTWEGKVHEVWKVRGQAGELRSSLLHYPHETMSEFLQEINFYTDLRAQEGYTKGIHVYWTSIVLYPVGKFLLNFFLRCGFLDGMQGFVFAVLMSFHSFLVRGKLWLLWKEKH